MGLRLECVLPDEESRSLQVVQNSLRVLEHVARHEPISLARLHRALGLPKTTVHRALHTLEVAGWVRCDVDDGLWRVTPRAVVLGSQAANAGGVRENALREMRALRDSCGEAVHLTVPDGDELVLIERLDSAQAVRTHNPIGARAPLHASANGKAILATLSPEELERRLPPELAAYTQRTATRRHALLEEIEEVRRLGFALNRGEWIPEVGAVAAAIVDRFGLAIAAISISAPIHRMPEEKAMELGPEVRAAAERASMQLGATPYLVPKAGNGAAGHMDPPSPLDHLDRRTGGRAERRSREGSRR